MEEDQQQQQQQPKQPQAAAAEAQQVTIPLPVMEAIYKGKPVKIELEATVIRADGSREELGTIDAYYANPVKQLAFNLRKFLKRKRKQVSTK